MARKGTRKNTRKKTEKRLDDLDLPSSPSSDSPSHDRLVATADRPPEETHKDLGPYFPRRSLRLGPNSIPTTGALYTSRLRRRMNVLREIERATLGGYSLGLGTGLKFPPPPTPPSDSPPTDRLVATAERPPMETHLDEGPHVARLVATAERPPMETHLDKGPHVARLVATAERPPMETHLDKGPHVARLVDTTERPPRHVEGPFSPTLFAGHSARSPPSRRRRRPRTRSPSPSDSLPTGITSDPKKLTPPSDSPPYGRLIATADRPPAETHIDLEERPFSPSMFAGNSRPKRPRMHARFGSPDDRSDCNSRSPSSETERLIATDDRERVTVPGMILRHNSRYPSSETERLIATDDRERVTVPGMILRDTEEEPIPGLAQNLQVSSLSLIAKAHIDELESENEGLRGYIDDLEAELSTRADRSMTYWTDEEVGRMVKEQIEEAFVELKEKTTELEETCEENAELISKVTSHEVQLQSLQNNNAKMKLAMAMSYMIVLLCILL